MNDVRRPKLRDLARKALLLIAFWGVAAMFMALFMVKESDLSAAREEVLREKSPSSDEPYSSMPEITRRNFEFRLPIPGEKGKYRWKVSGRESVSAGPATDRISDFKGEMVDRGDVTELSSPIALFDREKRVLSSRDGVVLQLEWAEVEAPEMTMEMKANYTEFSGGVVARIDTEKAPVSVPGTSSPSPGGKGSLQKTAPEKSKKGKEKKKKRSPLIITSKRLSLDLDKNLTIFTGTVVARDDSGTIYADRMEALNYTKEEEKRNPKLKGVKTVTCIGNVIIHQVEAKKQAKCVRAVYDATTNIVHLYGEPKTGKKVVYRDEQAKRQVKALELIFDRNKNKVIFDKEVESIDFNPDTKSFLGFMEPEKSPAEAPGQAKPRPGSGKKPRNAPE